MIENNNDCNEAKTQDCGIDCCGINGVIESVALEQAAISHILNAEGEKIQAVLDGTHTLNEILCVNKSVTNTIEQVTSLEIILLGKLKAVVDIPCPPQPTELGCINLTVEVCETKKPLCGVIVKLYDSENNLVDVGKTNKFGKYKKCCLPLGTYCLDIYDPTSNVPTRKCVTLNPEHHIAYLTECFNILPICHKIVVSARDCKCGGSIADVKIEILNCLNIVVDSGYTDANGIFASKCLDEGKYTITAYDINCGETKTQQATVLCDTESVYIEFCFSSGINNITIKGKVLNACKQPLNNAKVTAQGQSTETTYTNCDGEYTFKNISVCKICTVTACCNGINAPAHVINNITKSSYTVNFVIKI
ncbi:MAG: carboxypeptidase-like regulatory domain-containing protein [Clostridia bacterium]